MILLSEFLGKFNKKGSKWGDFWIRNVKNDYKTKIPKNFFEQMLDKQILL